MKKRRTTRLAQRPALPIVKRTMLSAKREGKQVKPSAFVSQTQRTLAQPQLTYAVLSKKRFFQSQVNGDCSICTVNNLLRTEVITVKDMNKAQDALRLLYRKREDYDSENILVCT